MFELRDSWVWDFWFVDDGETYHLFFLFASRALHDPDARHYRASIGHAISTDLRQWTRVEDALVRSDPPACDDLATWTGSIVHDDGLWHLFYTSATLSDLGNVQTVSHATSVDLVTWTKDSANPILVADARWYERLTDGQWHDEAFRDPWVFRDGDGWQMLITARANHGSSDDRGVIGQARSSDLRSWTLLPPLSEPGQGFAQLEVMQVEQVGGRWVLVFSCLDSDLSEAHRATGVSGGVWYAPAASATGPFDLAAARPLTDRRDYSGRLVCDRDSGDWLLVTFRHDGPDGEFVGGVTAPRRVAWLGDDLVAEPVEAPEAAARLHGAPVLRAG